MLLLSIIYHIVVTIHGNIVKKFNHNFEFRKNWVKEKKRSELFIGHSSIEYRKTNEISHEISISSSEIKHPNITYRR